jgi:hypothetical protein
MEEDNGWMWIIALAGLVVLSLYLAYFAGTWQERRAYTAEFVEATEHTYWDGFWDGYAHGRAKNIPKLQDVRPK